MILATLAAPALVQAGISPMQAHMFVLFIGILGMVTPPVALAAFAAATIAQVRSMEDRLDRDADELVRLPHPVHVRLFAGADHARRHRCRSCCALATALLGIFIGTMAVVGYFTAPIPAAFRIGLYARLPLMVLMLGSNCLRWRGSYVSHRAASALALMRESRAKCVRGPSPSACGR